MTMIKQLLFLVLASVALSSVIGSVSASAAASDPISPDHYCVSFTTNVPSSLPILLNVTRSWAPLGADRLYALINAHFFDVVPAAFFRVVPKFVVQFGLSGSPPMNQQWEDRVIVDDPVTQSNLKGTLSFASAGPNTRTTQVFINTVDNPRLDGMGFAPLARVVQGMDTVNRIFNPTPTDPMGVDQDAYATRGQEWIEKQYPGINSIVKATIVDRCDG